MVLLLRADTHLPNTVPIVQRFNSYGVRAQLRVSAVDSCRMCVCAEPSFEPATCITRISLHIRTLNYRLQVFR